ncbi:prepilin-type N-terminal cleavage/methylation domain-containing protein [Thaumasiovibrio subtropicus]|uniref:prepilin-type N-terminal cleavage/methylation domain-containing protein n=1 Tax=Thaumasiovibrio subtropicus TaxID=1891207 RepID=UPI000B3613C9|nr:prepilin-type N-terminal cleavage/methylation domain-containing protein [Thaumasiovibrio subtropicus]
MKVGSKQAQRGFSLVELVIVIVVIGLLAVAALPRFLDVTEEAKKSSIEGVAGGFATAVLSVRAQWEANGRTQDTNGFYVVAYDGTDMKLTAESESTEDLTIRSGYPFGLADSDGLGSALAIADTDCVDLMTELMQNPPQTATTTDFDATQHKYLATTVEDSNICTFYQMASANNTPTNLNGAHNFTYEPALGRVVVNLAD